MLIFSFLLYYVTSFSNLFFQDFQNQPLSNSNWNIIPTDYQIQTNNTNVLSLAYTTNFNQLVSTWINSVYGLYYKIQFDYYAKTKVLTFNSNQTYFGQSNLPKNHFILVFNMSNSFNLSLVNPFSKNSIVINLNFTTSKIYIYSVLNANTNKICQKSFNFLVSQTNLYYEYSKNQMQIKVGILNNISPLLTCQFNASNFIYDILYYSITSDAAFNLQIAKSDSDYHGFNLGIEFVQGGCNSSSNLRNCLIAFGYDYLDYPQLTKSIQSPAALQNYHITYIWKNIYSSSRFRLSLSDLLLYQDSPQSYDVYIDNITISQLSANQISFLEKSNSNDLVVGVNNISYINSLTGIQVSLISQKGYQSAQFDRLSGVTNINGTYYDDVIQLNNLGGEVHVFSGNDIVVTTGKKNTIYLGSGIDTVVVSCNQKILNLPDFSTDDILDLSSYGIFSNISTKLIIYNTTFLTVTITGYPIQIIMPKLISLNIAASYTPADCSKDIGIGYYPLLNMCIYSCPCNSVGFQCSYITYTQISNVANSQNFQSLENCQPYYLMTENYKNITYYTSTLNNVPHYQVTIEINAFVNNFNQGDNILIYQDDQLLLNNTLDISGIQRMCNKYLYAKPLNLTQSFSHYQNYLEIELFIQSLNTGATILLKQINVQLSQCYPGCIYCTGPALSNCYNCSATFIYNPVTGCVCASNAILNFTTCVDCSILFSQCLYCNLTACLLCEDQFILNSKNTCVNSTSCIADCKICNSSTTCSLCLPNFFLLNSTLCSKCADNCLKCTIDRCTLCQTLYFVSLVNATQCSFYCDSTCLNCLGPYNYQCTSCTTPRIYSADAQSCLCPISMYSDQNYICQTCPAPCYSCYNQYLCQSCYISFNFDPLTYTCSCPTGYYQQNNTICLPCSSGCQNCTNSSSCNTCSSNFNLSEFSCIKVSTSIIYNQTTTDVASSSLVKLSIAVTSIASLPILLSGNPFVLLQLFDITQQISYIQYINISYPDNFQNYLNAFAFVNLNFFPNIISDDNIVMEPPPGFLGNMDSLFFRNMSPYLIFAAIILGVYFFLKILLCLFGEKLKESLIGFVCQKLIGMFQWSGFIMIVLGAYTGLSLNAYLQLQNSSIRNYTMLFSYISAYIFLIVLIALLFLVYYLIEKADKIKSKQKREEYDKRFGALYINYQDNYSYQRYFILSTIIRKTIYTFILVYFNSLIIVQNCLFLVLQLSVLIITYKINPYKNLLLYRKDIITQCICIFEYITFILYSLNVLDSQSIIVGYIDIFLISLLIFVHLYVIVMEAYNDLKQILGELSEFIEQHKSPEDQNNQSEANLNEGAVVNLDLQIANQSTQHNINNINNQMHEQQSHIKMDKSGKMANQRSVINEVANEGSDFNQNLQMLNNKLQYQPSEIQNVIKAEPEEDIQQLNLQEINIKQKQVENLSEMQIVRSKSDGVQNLKVRQCEQQIDSKVQSVNLQGMNKLGQIQYVFNLDE